MFELSVLGLDIFGSPVKFYVSAPAPRARKGVLWPHNTVPTKMSARKITLTVLYIHMKLTYNTNLKHLIITLSTQHSYNTLIYHTVITTPIATILPHITTTI